MVQRSERCLSERLGEIVCSVKIPSTYGRTERPRGPLLQLGVETWFTMRRIGRRLRSGGSGLHGVDLEILPLVNWVSNSRLAIGVEDSVWWVV